MKAARWTAVLLLPVAVVIMTCPHTSASQNHPIDTKDLLGFWQGTWNGSQRQRAPFGGSQRRQAGRMHLTLSAIADDVVTGSVTLERYIHDAQFSGKIIRRDPRIELQLTVGPRTEIFNVIFEDGRIRGYAPASGLSFKLSRSE